MMVSTEGAPLLTGVGLIYSVRPDLLMPRFAAPDCRDLNLYLRGRPYHLAVVACATVRWETREMEDLVVQMTEGCWRSQCVVTKIYADDKELRQRIAETRRRTIPLYDDGAWLCGCYIAANWFFKDGKWLRIYEQTIRPVTQLAQSYDYGLNNIGPAGRQYSMM